MDFQHRGVPHVHVDVQFDANLSDTSSEVVPTWILLSSRLEESLNRELNRVLSTEPE